MSNPNEKLQAIFEAALALESDAQRADYLNRACPDPELRREVEALLAAHAKPDSVFADKTARIESVPTEIVGTQIGRYKLLELLGEGGFGSVWLAEQKEPVRRKVALKIIKLGMDTKQVIARFEAERQALALMDHPNIAKVLDGGTTERPLTRPSDTLPPSGGEGRGEGVSAPATHHSPLITSSGRPYFVMELVRGVPITTFCDENKLSTRERLDLFIQVCHAVQHAHQKGVIHRDLKPTNILVTLHDGVPVPKVIDFGIAKAMQQELTEKTIHTLFQQFIGTPAYVSPEQAQMSGLDLDTRSDIYTLGVLLYELLTGVTPFDQKELLAAGLDEMRRTIREVEPVKPSTRLTQARAARLVGSEDSALRTPRSVIADDLDWIVMKCLEKDRTRRYETANGLAADLTRHLNDEPVVARPPSRLYEFQKTVRRHKFGFAAAAAILLVLAGGITLSTWQAVRATRAEPEQSRLRAEAEAARRNEAGLRQTAQKEASRAEAAAGDLKKTLSTSDFLQGVRLVGEDNARDALPFLVRSLSVDPTNQAALTRLVTLLTYRSWLRPAFILKHDSKVSAAEFSPDGKRIVTVSRDQAQVWDAETGQPLTEPFGNARASASFSPDGARLVLVSKDPALSFWDSQTGQPLAKSIILGKQFSSAEFSLDGKRLLAGSRGEEFQVWNVETGELLLGPQPPPPSPTTNGPSGVYSANVVGYANIPGGGTETFESRPFAHFSPDGKQVATRSNTRGVSGARLWDAQSGAALTERIKHSAEVLDVDFSPEGGRLATASGDRTACVWETQTGRLVAGPLKHDGAVLSVKFSPDGSRVVTASKDHTARIWDARNGKPLGQPMKHANRVSSARFSANGRWVVTTSQDRTTRIWDAYTGQPLTETVQNALETAHFSPDGKRLVTTSGDRAAVVWEVWIGRPRSLPIKQAVKIREAEFDPTGTRVLLTSDDGLARVWDAQTGQPLTEPIRHGHILSAHFSPDGKKVVTASDDSTARVWDARTAQPVFEPIKHSKRVSSAEFSPDGLRIVTASDDGTARLWDARTGEPLSAILKHKQAVVSAQFSADGKRIVTAFGTAVRVWDAETGQPVGGPMASRFEFKASDHVKDYVKISPDGKRILSSHFYSDTAWLWDAENGQLLHASMKHDGSIRSAAFSPDGRRIVTASHDETARVWDAETGRPVTEPMKHGSWLWYAEFSPDGKRIVTAGSDGTARVWDVETGQPLSDPLPHPHRHPVDKARFGPGGRQVVGVGGGIAGVWDIAPALKNIPPWLFPLAEALSGQALNQQGALEPTGLNCPETLRQIQEQLKQQPGDDDWVVWGRWLFADPATRTVSPFAKVTVPEYLERLLKESTRQSLDEAEPLAAGKPELLRRISEQRAKLEQAQK